MTLNERAQAIHAANVAKGFWPENPAERNKHQAIALTIGEVYEALEAYRTGKRADWVNYDAAIADPANESIEAQSLIFKTYIKDSWEDEIADCVIRLLDYCGGFQLNLRERTELSATTEAPSLDFSYQVIAVNHYLLQLHTAHVESQSEAGAAMAASLALAGILNWGEVLDFDIWKHVDAKLAYNANRPYKHGKDF